MSKSPEDDTASKATERGKTSASQTLRETDGGQEQVEGKEGGGIRERGGRKGKPSTQKEALHDSPR